MKKSKTKKIWFAIGTALTVCMIFLIGGIFFGKIKQESEIFLPSGVESVSDAEPVNITIEDSNFVGNGAFLKVYNNMNVNVVNCDFIFREGATGSSAIFVSGGSLCLENVTVSAESGTEVVGAGVLVQSAENVKMTNVVVRGINNVDGVTNINGGGIAILNANDFIADDVYVEDCTSQSGHGAGIYLGTVTTFEMNGGHIDNCESVSGSGGGLYVQSGKNTLNNVSITGNVAAVTGGGVFSKSTINLNSCVVDENTIEGESEDATRGSGAGIFATGSKAIVTIDGVGSSVSSNVIDSDNTAVQYGAGIAVLSSAKLHLRAGTLADNDMVLNQKSDGSGVVDNYGAGIGTNSATVMIGATEDGNIVSNDIVISGTNVDTTESVALGGGLYFNYGTIKIYKAIVEDHEGGYGGGVYIRRSKNFVIGHESEKSMVTTADANVQFLSNYSHEIGGGALHLFDCETVLNGAYFSGNSSAKSGGAIHLRSSNSTSYDMNLHMYNGLIDGNYVSDAYTDEAKTVHRGGGIVVANGSVMNMYGGVISHNRAMRGGGISMMGSGTLNLYGGSIEENTASYYGGGVALHTGTVYIMGTRFVANSISNDHNHDGYDSNCGCGKGAGVYVNGSTVYMQKCTNGVTDEVTIVENNFIPEGTSEPIGAGLYVTNSSSFYFSDGEFVDNKIETDHGRGGNIFVAGTASFEMTGGKVLGNGVDVQAEWGGGVAGVGDISLLGGEIRGNVATNGGGVVSFESVSSSDGLASMTIGGDVVIAGNSADGGVGDQVVSANYLNIGGSPQIDGEIILASFENNYESSGYEYIVPKINVVETLDSFYEIQLGKASYDNDIDIYSIELSDERFDDIIGNQNEYLVTFEDGVARHDTDFSISGMYLQFPELVTGDVGLCINETPIIVHYLKDETTGKLSAFGSKYRGGNTAPIRNDYEGMPVTSIADHAFGPRATGFMFNESGALVFSGGEYIGTEFAISDIIFQDAETSQISVIGEFAFMDAFHDDGVSVSFDNFPDAIKTLKFGAFQGSGITGNSDGVMDLSGVVTIESAVFGACENITAIEIGTTCTTLAVDFAEDATNLQYVHMLKSLFTNSGGKIATNASGTATIDYLKSSDKSPFIFGNSPIGGADDGKSAGLFVYEAKDSNGDGVAESYLIGGAKDHVRSGDELLRLPKTYAGRPIAGTILRGFRDCDELKQVYIPFSLGANTAGFYHCSNLEKIIMTSACTTLRGSTLSYCPKLTTIGYETPSGQIIANDGIAELHYTTILQGNVLEYAGITDIVFSASTLKITATSLLNMLNLENIAIDTEVDTIATGFLAGLPNIKSIDVTDSSGKFTGNEDKTVLVYSKTTLRAAGGTEVVIPDGVTTIEANAFGTSEVIETLSLPSSLSSFDSAMLADLANLETLEIGRKISLSSLAIPATVTQLRARSDGETGNALLSSVTFAEGSNLEIIGDYAFYSYPQLSSFAFPSGVTTIGVSAFEKCTGLAGTLSLPSALTTLGESAFKDCALLTGAVVAPDLLEAIPEEAFYGCSGITSFKVSRSVESIDPSAFFYTSELYSFDVDANNPKYEDINEAIVEKSTKTIVRGCTMTKFESGILAVGPYAFRTVPTLGTVVLPEGVETIGNEAFSYCDGLITISIPASVTTIGEVICHASGDLTTINVNSNNAHYKKEGNCLVDVETKSIIQGCSGSAMTATMDIVSISDFAFHGMDLNKAIVIPSSVRTIGFRAFMNADITGMLVIPASVESIGELAFSGNKFTALQILTSKLLIGSNIFASSGSHHLETSLTSLATASNLGENAFDLYPNLASVEILPTVTEMGRDAFLGCSKLTSLIVNDMASFAEIKFANAQANPLYYAKKFDGIDEIDLTGATQIGAYAFCNMEYKNIDIPGSVESIGDYAFYMSALGDGGNVDIRRGVKTVGVCAFSNLRLLDSNTTQQQPYLSYIYFPDTISSIGAYVLSGSRTYSLYVYGDGSLNIGAYTFADATILNTLTLGRGINKIVSSAFSEVKTSHTSVFISSDVKQIAGGVSTGIEYSEIFYTAYVKWEGAFVGFNYTSMSISGDVPTGWETAWYATPNGRISVKNGEGYIEIGDVDALVENMLEEFDAGEFDGVYQENADIVGRGFAKNVVSFTLWDFEKFMNSDYYL